MEWLFKKMIENVGESYSPEKVKQILDHHQETIAHQQETIVYILLGITFLSFCFLVYAITNEIRFYKFRKKVADKVTVP